MSFVNTFDYYIPQNFNVASLSLTQLTLWEKRCTEFLEKERADFKTSSMSDFVWSIIELRDKIVCRINQLIRKTDSGLSSSPFRRTHQNKWLLTCHEIEMGYKNDDAQIFNKECGCMIVLYNHETRAPLHRFYQMCMTHSCTFDHMKSCQKELSSVLMSTVV